MNRKLTPAEIAGFLILSAAFLAWQINAAFQRGEPHAMPPESTHVPEDRPPFTGEIGYMKGFDAYAETESDLAEFAECFEAADKDCIRKMVHEGRIHLAPDGTRIRVVETDLLRDALRVRLLSGPAKQTVVWISTKWVKRKK